eukprot:5196321-Prymnesium_polylepis.1
MQDARTDRCRPATADAAGRDGHLLLAARPQRRALKPVRGRGGNAVATAFIPAANGAHEDAHLQPRRTRHGAARRDDGALRPPRRRPRGA